MSKVLRSSLPRAGQPLISTHPGSYLTQINGQWYVRSEMTGYDVPDLHANYYRVISSSGGGYGWAPELTEGVRLEERNTAVYCFKVPGSDYRYVRIDPQATAEYIDQWDIPCPPVRKGIETRWHKGAIGYWEKYLKTKGWVPA